MVVNAVPFHFTTELFINPLPFTVKVKAAEPAFTLSGTMVCSDGVGLLPAALIVKTWLFDVPPPGAELITVTLPLPATVNKDAGTRQVSCKELTNVVVNAVPFQLITDDAIKLFPFTVMVKAAAPTVTLAGDMELIAGTGFVEILLIVNVNEPDVPPAGAALNTVTAAVPAVAIRLPGTNAVNCVAFTNVVVSAVPFQLITEPLIKLLPETVMVNAGSPAVAPAGKIEPATGTGFEAPPPGLTEESFLQEMVNSKNNTENSKMILVIVINLMARWIGKPKAAV